MSRIIFGMCDVDNGVLISEGIDEDTQETVVTVNVFGDGSHAYATMDQSELEALHIGLSRYLGIPVLVADTPEVEVGTHGSD